MNYIKLLFSNNSILRILQINEFKKYKFSGNCLEFGANHKMQRNFLNKHSKAYQVSYSNIDNKNKTFIKINLNKKNTHKKKYENIVIFNVLEHVSEVDIALRNLNLLLNRKGKILGSTPFLYRVHGAPNDYNRFTKSYLQKILEKKNFINIKIEEIGLGPFLASFSLLRGLFKYIPIIYQILMIIVIIMDTILVFAMKTNPKKIYPIGYVFSAIKK
jgi:hypothetical protein